MMSDETRRPYQAIAAELREIADKLAAIEDPNLSLDKQLWINLDIQTGGVDSLTDDDVKVHTIVTVTRALLGRDPVPEELNYGEERRWYLRACSDSSGRPDQLHIGIFDTISAERATQLLLAGSQIVNVDDPDVHAILTAAGIAPAG